MATMVLEQAQQEMRERVATYPKKKRRGKNLGRPVNDLRGKVIPQMKIVELTSERDGGSPVWILESERGQKCKMSSRQLRRMPVAELFNEVTVEPIISIYPLREDAILPEKYSK